MRQKLTRQMSIFSVTMRHDIGKELAVFSEILLDATPKRRSGGEGLAGRCYLFFYFFDLPKTKHCNPLKSHTITEGYHILSAIITPDPTADPRRLNHHLPPPPPADEPNPDGQGHDRRGGQSPRRQRRGLIGAVLYGSD